MLCPIIDFNIIKKILSISILLAFFLSYLGLNIYYAIGVFIVKEKASVKISHNSDIQSITITNVEYEKSKVEENEISFQGNLYDIVSVKIVGNKVVLKMIKDDLETELINWYNSLPNRNENQKIILKFILLVFIIPSSIFIFGFLLRPLKHFIYFLKEYPVSLLHFYPPPKSIRHFN